MCHHAWIFHGFRESNSVSMPVLYHLSLLCSSRVHITERQFEEFWLCSLQGHPCPWQGRTVPSYCPSPHRGRPLLPRSAGCRGWVLGSFMADGFFLLEGCFQSKGPPRFRLGCGLLGCRKEKQRGSSHRSPLDDSGEGVMESQSSPSSHAGSAKLDPSPAGRLNILAAPPPPWLLGMCPFALAIPRVGRHIGFLNFGHFHSP